MSFELTRADDCRVKFVWCLVLLLTIMLTLGGCRYPEVSPRTYELATALYTATNLKQEARLDAVEVIIEESLSQGLLSEKEADYLRDIIETARGGAWETAQKEVRQLMEDQVRD